MGVDFHQTAEAPTSVNAKLRNRTGSRSPLAASSSMRTASVVRSRAPVCIGCKQAHVLRVLLVRSSGYQDQTRALDALHINLIVAEFEFVPNNLARLSAS
jgi:hypothetical protein